MNTISNLYFLLKIMWFFYVIRCKMKLDNIGDYIGRGCLFITLDKQSKITQTEMVKIFII